MSFLCPLGVFALAICACVCAVTDVVWRKIPNKIIVLMLAVEALGIGWCASRVGWLAVWNTGLGTGLATAFAVLVVGAVLFMRGTVGAGDVKLAAALSPWMASDAPLFVIVFSLFGGFLVLLLPGIRWLEKRLGLWVLAWAAKKGNTAAPMPAAFSSDERLVKGLPYGVAIAAGACAVMAINLPLGR